MRYWNTSNCSVPTTPTMTSSMPEFGSLKIWIAPSCAICSVPLMNCLRFIESLGLTREKCSGAKVGMPPNLNFLPGVQMVSPIEKMPGSKTPMMSPAYASSTISRSEAISCCGWERRIFLFPCT